MTWAEEVMHEVAECDRWFVTAEVGLAAEEILRMLTSYRQDNDVLIAKFKHQAEVLKNKEKMCERLTKVLNNVSLVMEDHTNE